MSRNAGRKAPVLPGPVREAGSRDLPPPPRLEPRCKFEPREARGFVVTRQYADTGRPAGEDCRRHFQTRYVNLYSE
ncbi:hypothetical protein FQA47_019474 [Oryzias melastigma]|uniref:Uncharacterized protein n=1 Tax=Oryzias melastigma TaxID=30732 RepID=A0A834CBZ2_ORYME|nr:hypothetical protein FQA47_019474 [Oryzias melastigma]